MIEKILNIIGMLFALIPTKVNRANRIEATAKINEGQLAIRNFCEKWLSEIEKKHLSVKNDDGGVYIACLQNMYTKVPETNRTSPWDLHSLTIATIIKGMDADIALLKSSAQTQLPLTRQVINEAIRYYEYLKEAVLNHNKEQVKRTGDTFIAILKKV